MAPFNKRQIGYIQAIAGRQQHRTLICGSEDKIISSADAPGDLYKPKTLLADKVTLPLGTGTSDDAKSLLLHTFMLDQGSPLAFDSRSVHNDSVLQPGDYNTLYHADTGTGVSTQFSVFNAPVKGSHDLVHTSTSVENGDGNDIYQKTTLSGASRTGELVRNPEHISSLFRATQDGFLNSTDVKFRFTLPRTLDGGTHSGSHDHPMGQDHYEFRWIVWRQKKPTLGSSADSTTNNDANLEAIRDGVSLRNPAYDFFMGQTGRKRGLLGYTLNADLDKEKILDAPNGEVYCGYRREGSNLVNTGNMLDGTFPTADGTFSPKAGIPAKEQGFSVDDLMTARINKDDYVVMKDVRFFIGKEHGKSHFEDTLHWDWNDPIDTPSTNVLSSPTLNSKNYRWHMTLIGTSGGSGECALNATVRWTTKMESG